MSSVNNEMEDVFLWHDYANRENCTCCAKLSHKKCALTTIGIILFCLGVIAAVLIFVVFHDLAVNQVAAARYTSIA
jgi:hypothetical protein